jgi:hypothetical protein
MGCEASVIVTSARKPRRIGTSQVMFRVVQEAHLARRFPTLSPIAVKWELSVVKNGEFPKSVASSVSLLQTKNSCLV